MAQAVNPVTGQPDQGTAVPKQTPQSPTVGLVPPQTSAATPAAPGAAPATGGAPPSSTASTQPPPSQSTAGLTPPASGPNIAPSQLPSTPQATVTPPSPSASTGPLSPGPGSPAGGAATVTMSATGVPMINGMMVTDPNDPRIPRDPVSGLPMAGQELTDYSNIANAPGASTYQSTTGTNTLQGSSLPVDAQGRVLTTDANGNTVPVTDPGLNQYLIQEAPAQAERQALEKQIASGQPLTPDQELEWNALAAQIGNAGNNTTLHGGESLGAALSDPSAASSFSTGEYVTDPATGMSHPVGGGVGIVNPKAPGSTANVAAANAPAQYLQGGQTLDANGNPVASGYNALADASRQATAAGLTPGVVTPAMQDLLALNPSLAASLPVSMPTTQTPGATTLPVGGGSTTFGLPTGTSAIPVGGSTTFGLPAGTSALPVGGAVPPGAASPATGPGNVGFNSALSSSLAPSAPAPVPGSGGLSFSGAAPGIGGGTTAGGVSRITNPATDLRSTLITDQPSAQTSSLTNAVDQGLNSLNSTNRQAMVDQLMQQYLGGETDPRLTGLQSQVDQAASQLAGVNRFDLANQQFGTYSNATDPAYQLALKQAGDKMAAMGQSVSGAANTSYGDLALQRTRDLTNERDALFQNALQGSIADTFQKESALSGLENQYANELLAQQGQAANEAGSNASSDIATREQALGMTQGEEAASRAYDQQTINNLRNERAYEAAQAQQGITNAQTARQQAIETLYAGNQGNPSAANIAAANAINPAGDMNAIGSLSTSLAQGQTAPAAGPNLTPQQLDLLNGIPGVNTLPIGTIPSRLNIPNVPTS